MDDKVRKVIKKLIKEGYALKAHHTFKFTDKEVGNVEWKKALEAAEDLLLEDKQKNQDKAQLCKCGNCEAIMYDENPDDQPEVVVPEGVLSMSKDERGFWACPNCGTDEYLQDVMEL